MEASIGVVEGWWFLLFLFMCVCVGHADKFNLAVSFHALVIKLSSCPNNAHTPHRKWINIYIHIVAVYMKPFRGAGQDDDDDVECTQISKGTKKASRQKLLLFIPYQRLLLLLLDSPLLNKKRQQKYRAVSSGRYIYIYGQQWLSGRLNCHGPAWRIARPYSTRHSLSIYMLLIFS